MIAFMWFYITGGLVSLGLLVLGAAFDEELQDRIDRVADERGDAYLAMLVLVGWLPLLLMAMAGGGGRRR